MGRFIVVRLSMKINEKTLASFANSPSPPDKEGWLLKRGEVNRAYQRRWCVLRGNLLFYSVNQGDKEPLGVIILEGCTVELAEEETELNAFKIVFHGDTGKVVGRTYTLGTHSQEELEDWMKLVACASYDYIKLMLGELEQQLKEVSPGGGVGGRSNPFTNMTGTPGQGGKQGRPGKQWQQLHREWGSRIVADRTAWLSRGNAVISMSEDTLLVVI